MISNRILRRKGADFNGSCLWLSTVGNNILEIRNINQPGIVQPLYTVTQLGISTRAVNNQKLLSRGALSFLNYYQARVGR